MAKKLSKETEEEIANIFGKFNEELANLARNKIMNAFSVGSANLDRIKKNVSGFMQNSADITNKLRGSYQNTADMSKGPAREKAPSLPSTTPQGPGGSTPGLT